jgi:hypothetical protein
MHFFAPFVSSLLRCLEVDYRGQHPQLEFRVDERPRSAASAITFERGCSAAPFPSMRPPDHPACHFDPSRGSAHHSISNSRRSGDRHDSYPGVAARPEPATLAVKLSTPLPRDAKSAAKVGRLTVDGEAVVIGQDGLTDFEALRRRQSCRRSRSRLRVLGRHPSRIRRPASIQQADVAGQRCSRALIQEWPLWGSLVAGAEIGAALLRVALVEHSPLGRSPT